MGLQIKKLILNGTIIKIKDGIVSSIKDDDELRLIMLECPIVIPITIECVFLDYEIMNFASMNPLAAVIETHNGKCILIDNCFIDIIDKKTVEFNGKINIR